MARTENVLSIFLASPSDVCDERNRLAEVITHWNRAWSRHFSVRLELLRWEDDAYPDIGEDPQAVINRQLPVEWDLFVGIMWSRFGTATNRSGSGTEEEFERALARHRTSPGSIGILFYFKDAPMSPSKIDPAQLEKVKAFKKLTQQAGLLTWEFTDTDQFEKLVEIHITKHFQDQLLNLRSFITQPALETNTIQVVKTSQPTEAVSTQSALQDEYEDDAGYLDLVEAFAKQSSEIEQITLRIAAAQNDLTIQTTLGRSELDKLQADPSNFSTKKFRSTIAQVAAEMLKFAARLEEEVPLFRSSVDLTISSMIRLATVSAELYPQQIAETKLGAFNLLKHLIDARKSTEGFRDSTAALPRMTKELNVAKRKQVAALNALVTELENAERLTTEGLTVIKELTDRGNSAPQLPIS